MLRRSGLCLETVVDGIETNMKIQRCGRQCEAVVRIKMFYY